MLVIITHKTIKKGLNGAVAEKEGNALFNETLNTFYLSLHGVGHMVREETCCHYMGYSFQLGQVRDFNVHIQIKLL